MIKLKSLMEELGANHLKIKRLFESGKDSTEIGPEIEGLKERNAEIRSMARESRSENRIDNPHRNPDTRYIINPLPPGIFPMSSTPRHIAPDPVFDTFSQFLLLTALEPHDKRVAPLKQTIERRDMQTTDFALPEQFKDQLHSVPAQQAIVRPRATVMSAGHPPDALLRMPSVDQTTANMYGGIIVTHSGESLSMAETEASLRSITLEPKEMTAYVVVSDKLLMNWFVCETVLFDILRRAMAGAEDYDMMRGNGVNRCTGFINHSAALVHPRTSAGQIVLADLLAMITKVPSGSSPVWVASQTIIPQLAQLVDNAQNKKSIWLGGRSDEMAAKGLPAELLGKPIFFSDRAPGLGSKGDLSLVDLSYYLVKDGSGPFMALSSHVPGLYERNLSALKIRWNVDGHPWLEKPIILEGGHTVSPFVILE